MHKKDDRKGRGSFAFCAVCGLVAGILSAASLLAIASAVVLSGGLPESSMPAVTLAAAFVGALIGAVVSAKKHRSRIMSVGLCVAGLMFLISLLCSAFNDDGALSGAFALLPAYLLGGAAGGLLCAGKRRKRRI